MRVLIGAILCAVVCITAIAFSIDAIRQKLDQSLAQIVGGDVVINSNEPLEPKIYELLQANNLRYSENISFYSMVATKEDLLLSAVKAADDNYPLLGELTVSPAPGAESTVLHNPPPPGEIWLESRALMQLGAKIGDQLQVGNANLKVTAILTSEPDRIADGFTFAPRVMMNIKDVAKTEAIVPGSRVTYKILVTGSQNNLSKFATALQANNVGKYWLSDVKSNNRSLQNLDLAEKYLNLALIINVILAGVTVAIAANRYSTIHTVDAAVMRCLGASQKQLLLIYTSNLAVIAVVVGSVGSAIGFGIHSVIARILTEIINLKLEIPSLWPLFIGVGSALFLMLLFGLPALIALAKTPPMQVLHNTSLSTRSSSWRMHFNLSNRIPAIVRLGINNIGFNSAQNLLQIMAFAIIICVGTILYITRDDLLHTWQAQIPQNMPNYFVLNIPGDLVQPFSAYLTKHNIRLRDFYPIVRGDLLKINEQKVSQNKEPGTREGLNRSLNLTWAENLPYENKVIAGHWFSSDEHGQPLLSIEQELAKRLDIKLGDELTFNILGKDITAKVNSIRTVVWSSFTPNFYVIYNPGVLTNINTTYITSFYMSLEQEKLLLEIARTYPQINIINVAQMIDQAQEMISLISLVIAFIWSFTLIIGILLLLAVMLSGLNIRLYQNNLLRILGSPNKQLLGIFLAEYTILGAIAGFIGSMIAIIAAKQISSSYFSLFYPLQWQVVIWGIIIGVALMLFGGLIGYRKVIKHAPIQLLRIL